MQRSNQPNIELERARASLTAMLEAQGLDDFEAHWKEYLHRLERVWNKVAANYKRSPKWDNWSGKVLKDRRSDPLLSYLTNARGADEHGIDDILQRTAGGIGIGPAEGNSFYIEGLTIDAGLISFKSSHNVKVSFLPAEVKLTAVVNRGRTYGVPTTHLGQPIDPTNVGSVAKAALRFYATVVADAEGYFVK